MAADPRFFEATGPHSLAAIAAAAEGRFEGDGGHLFVGIGSLPAAGPDEVSFLDNRRYVDALETTRAGAVVVDQEMAGRVPAGCVPILVAQPALGFARIAGLFHPSVPRHPGIHPTAVVGAGVDIGEGTEIGPYAVVGDGASIGPASILGAHAVVGRGVVLGARARIHDHASISHTIAGDDVVLHPGARVGNEGFGFTTDATTGRHVTMPQLGRVILGDGVEIGANATIDRGASQDTQIGVGTRIDNLVQIGHNVRTGRGCVAVAQVGISGSTTLGDYVVLAGQAGVAGHLTIGAGARIGAQAGVTKDVAPGLDVAGLPAQPARDHWREVAALRRIAGSGRPAQIAAAGAPGAVAGRNDRKQGQD
ncbi:MAG TPA: UDP-3-O-(3-hydroxymyristoyl)glucosamine N-acyltransferase [Roseomonas sp.]|jgi:UDP-3-O-[3-hydroxymyristoyl] glucosamine N-acyltransferase